MNDHHTCSSLPQPAWPFPRKMLPLTPVHTPIAHQPPPVELAFGTSATLHVNPVCLLCHSPHEPHYRFYEG
jgi:hypothetical protein